jgi:hypothetical protein
MTTDTGLAVVELNDCHSPRLSTESSDDSPVPEHGGNVQLFARREILSLRNDLLRNNWFWRGYEITRWIGGILRTHVRESSGARSFLISFRHSSLPAAPVRTASIRH